MTRQSLAASIGVTKTTMNRLEQGSTRPSTQLIERIASVLEIEMMDLFNFHDSAKPSEAAEAIVLLQRTIELLKKTRSSKK